MSDQHAYQRSRLELVLEGRLAGPVLRTLEDRYEDVRATHGPDATIIVVAGLDQAGERAVLNLVWDTGHQIRAVVRHPS